ncbi:hypothetical protein A3G63_01960 [Candidatus Kaiserbacteria bacterium RIFCSPLOWO2_12_FULL_52_8]|uniref:Type 4 fimbrial biogenesis protein PilX N-terminal domain-containing protein n=1 Tax=Candidatus Kaiserbacteria bacterium RIFCSPHIGHO2_01_FULL_53_31 TaxID=1798481 RepID=A0A1F6CGB4_9BACT|nr:MAG: hypothetical protein A2678_00290 [Candidatus Kaiserbacteria bacterium RIFCSPHIGHO2_01_FULL_53_31]OGG94312.1 MAG: hypothetical protein A3G63_01960 [Candidatus Kaiserbacteria bacterium RIFCSPLOWO2_12_FULL_52_8]
MAMKDKNRGFALLVAVIFMTVMLSFGLTLGSLGYKQQVLSSTAVSSQYAFYAADAALECVLLADQDSRDKFFERPDGPRSPARLMTCDGSPAHYPPEYPNDGIVSDTASLWAVAERLELDGGAHCVDVSVYKYTSPQGPGNFTTYLFAQGYNVPCDKVEAREGRFSSRGLQAHY